MPSSSWARHAPTSIDLSLYGRTLYLLGKGLVTELPGMHTAFCGPQGGGGSSTQSSSYCYGVWLKHLSLLHEHGMCVMPQTVLELGPGSSLGTGLAALLSGAERYIGIDVVRHADLREQTGMLTKMTELFLARAPRPHKGWPDYDHCLDGRLFPSHILTEERLARALLPERLELLKSAVAALGSGSESVIRYATWDDAAPVADGEADLIFSHGVFVVAHDLDGMYAHMARWLKPGGWMSHQTDFSSLRNTPGWNGHLQYSERLWRRIAGGRPFFPNQERLSRQLELLRKHGFEKVSVLCHRRFDGVPRAQLAKRWQDQTDDDHYCSGAVIIARKPS
jgi:SAM-dependent methyltransferase